MTFPTKEEVNFNLLSGLKLLTCHPMTKSQAANFKSILQGYVSTKTGYPLPNVHSLHNQVHIVLGGAMGDVSSASNNSIFPLHHFFVDRIYEKWLRKFNKNASVLSTDNSPIGHNKDDVIVPLYPVYTHQRMFKKSFEFGYDNDNVDENGKYT